MAEVQISGQPSQKRDAWSSKFDNTQLHKNSKKDRNSTAAARQQPFRALTSVYRPVDASRVRSESHVAGQSNTGYPSNNQPYDFASRGIAKSPSRGFGLPVSKSTKFDSQRTSAKDLGEDMLKEDLEAKRVEELYNNDAKDERDHFNHAHDPTIGTMERVTSEVLPQDKVWIFDDKDRKALDKTDFYMLPRKPRWKEVEDGIMVVDPPKSWVDFNYCMENNEGVYTEWCVQLEDRRKMALAGKRKYIHVPIANCPIFDEAFSFTESKLEGLTKDLTPKQKKKMLHEVEASNKANMIPSMADMKPPFGYIRNACRTGIPEEDNKESDDSDGGSTKKSRKKRRLEYAVFPTEDRSVYPLQGRDFIVKPCRSFQPFAKVEYRIGFSIAQPQYPLPKQQYAKANVELVGGEDIRKYSKLFGVDILENRDVWMSIDLNKEMKTYPSVPVIVGEPPLPDEGACSAWYSYNYAITQVRMGLPYSRYGMVKPTAIRPPRNENSDWSMYRMMETNTGFYPVHIFCEFGLYTLQANSDRNHEYVRDNTETGNRKYEIPVVLNIDEINFDYYKASVPWTPYLSQKALNSLKKEREKERTYYDQWNDTSVQELLAMHEKFVAKKGAGDIDLTRLTMHYGKVYYYYDHYYYKDHKGPNQRSGNDKYKAQQIKETTERVLTWWKTRLHDENLIEHMKQHKDKDVNYRYQIATNSKKEESVTMFRRDAKMGVSQMQTTVERTKLKTKLEKIPEKPEKKKKSSVTTPPATPHKRSKSVKSTIPTTSTTPSATPETSATPHKRSKSVKPTKSAIPATTTTAETPAIPHKRSKSVKSVKSAFPTTPTAPSGTPATPHKRSKSVKSTKSAIPIPTVPIHKQPSIDVCSPDAKSVSSVPKEKRSTSKKNFLGTPVITRTDTALSSVSAPYYIPYTPTLKEQKKAEKQKKSEEAAKLKQQNAAIKKRSSRKDILSRLGSRKLILGSKKDLLTDSTDSESRKADDGPFKHPQGSIFIPYQS